MDKVTLEAALTHAGLAQFLKDIDRLSQASIRLKASPQPETAFSVGQSKLGGQPDLPLDMAWPLWHGIPQSFLAQIRLADAHPYDAPSYLPSEGMLWFFYDAQQETYGDHPSDLGGWNVTFRADLTALRRVAFPSTLPAKSRFQSCSLSFASEMTLTQHPELEIPDLAWTAEEQTRYEHFLAGFPDLADHATTHHRLLGFPDAIQDDMRLQCQLLSHGIPDEDDPRAQALHQGACDWQLLLQVDTDERAGMRWASTGMLYFWTPVADVRVRDFTASWLVLQSE